MSETAEEKSTSRIQQNTESITPYLEFQEVVSEIVDLCYSQALSAVGNKSSSEVCAAFLDLLKRHWNPSSIAIYLVGDHSELLRSAFYSDEHLDTAKAQEIAMLLALVVKRQGAEIQVGISEETPPTSDDEHQLTEAMADGGVRSGIAVPINAQGVLRGVLVALTTEPASLIAALDGLRFLAAPIIVAVERTRQHEAMLQQQKQIERLERLVDQLRRDGSALEEANGELRRIALYRSLFLARMSHELRTPLTAILGFAEILLDQEKMPEPQRSFCERIQNSGLQLQSSLNQLVDLSRLEDGRSELLLHEFSIRETVRESCAAVTRLAEKGSVKVECHWSPDLNSIVSDEGKLRQVFYNLLANAISRTKPGGIVTVRTENIEKSGCRIVIEDHGLPVSDLSRVFEAVEVHTAADRHVPMGQLGLVIAKRLIELLDGTVRLESSKSGGLRVSLELPALPGGKEA